MSAHVQGLPELIVPHVGDYEIQLPAGALQGECMYLLVLCEARPVLVDALCSAKVLSRKPGEYEQNELVV